MGYRTVQTRTDLITLPTVILDEKVLVEDEASIYKYIGGGSSDLNNWEYTANDDGYVYKGELPIGVGFDMQSRRPLNRKEFAKTLEDLKTIPNCYEGIEVKVRADGNKKYMWNGLDQTDLNNWKLVANPAAPPSIVDLGYTPDPAKGTVTNTDGIDAELPLANTTNAGLLSPGDKGKLDNIIPGHLGCVTKDIKATIDVGGIDTGDLVVDGTCLTDFVEQLISPLILPTIKVINSANVGGVVPTKMEIGSAYSQQLAYSYNRGLIESKDGHVDVPLTGAATGATWTGTGIDANGLINTIIMPNGNSWVAEVAYALGTDLYYDSNGDSASNLNSQRGPGSSLAATAVITGNYHYWFTTGSIPTTSAGVRALTGKGFYPKGSFDIVIPAFTKPVAFYLPVPHGNVTINYLESFNLDVTGDFAEIAMNVNDANGSAVAYKRFETNIPGVGYDEIATYRVTIN